MVVRRGEVWWADLEEPRGSAPGFRRPLVVIQSDAFNESRIQTVIAVVVTSNLRLVDAPGNVFLPAKASGLPKDSVANVSQIVTVDREVLSERAASLDAGTMTAISRGLRLVLQV
ncbi:MAG: type II toxin-antitoxin system PemK/MazF family toxin [bacterium]